MPTEPVTLLWTLGRPAKMPERALFPQIARQTVVGFDLQQMPEARMRGGAAGIGSGLAD